MLGHKYRFKVQNKTGQTLAIGAVTVKTRRWSIASDGALSFEGSEGSPYTNAGTIANNAYDAGTAQDNSSLKWMGGDFVFTVTAPTSSSGDVILFFERSTDGSVWDTNGLVLVVATINFTASGTQTVSFSL